MESDIRHCPDHQIRNVYHVEIDLFSSHLPLDDPYSFVSMHIRFFMFQL